MSELFAYGGGTDNYYGNYGSSGLGPTSYNPYGTGSPAQSVYTGAGVAAPSAGSVTDQYGGRVANNTVLSVTNKDGTHVIASGSPNALLLQAEAIINTAAYDNRYYVDSYRAPMIRVPAVGVIDFASSQAFKNYLTRSTSYLIPESAIVAAFQGTFGRAPDQGNIISLENLINAGGSLATVQWYLAHTQEGANVVNGLFDSVYGRPLDQTTMPEWQNRLGSTSLKEMKTYLAHLPEATDHINDVFLQTFGHGISADSIAGRQEQLAASSLDAIRWDIAHTPEATGKIDQVYRDTVDRGLDALSISGRQDQLGAHGSSLAAVRLSVSQSQETADKVNGVHALLLGRTLGPTDTYNIQVNYLAQGGSIGNLRLAVANSPEAQVDFDSKYYLQQNLDVASAGVNPYVHYATYGWKEGRNPDAYFGSSPYLQRNPDVAAAGVNPLIHYRTYGWREGRDPSTNFSTSAYLTMYPDVAAAGVDPLQHFLQFGQREGRLSFAVGSSTRADQLAVLIASVPISPEMITNPETSALLSLLSRVSAQVTAATIATVNSQGLNLSSTQYGTLLHTQFEAAINEIKATGALPNVRLETSFKFGEEVDYGEVSSKRTDVILRDNDGFVIAIFDYKTSFLGLPRVVSSARAAALQAAVAKPGQVAASIPVYTIPIVIAPVPVKR